MDAPPGNRRAADSAASRTSELTALKERLIALEGRSDTLGGQQKALWACALAGFLLVLGAAGFWIRSLQKEQQAQAERGRQETTASIDTKSAELDAQIKVAFESIRKLEGQMMAVRTNQATLFQRMAGVQSSIAPLTERLGQHSNWISAVETDANDIGAQLFQVAQDFKGFAEDGFRQYQRIESVDGQLGTLTTGLQGVGARQAALAQQVLGFSNQVQSIQTPLRLWVERVTELEARLASVSRSLSALAGRNSSAGVTRPEPPGVPSARESTEDLKPLE